MNFVKHKGILIDWSASVPARNERWSANEPAPASTLLIREVFAACAAVASGTLALQLGGRLRSSRVRCKLTQVPKPKNSSG